MKKKTDRKALKIFMYISISIIVLIIIIPIAFFAILYISTPLNDGCIVGNNLKLDVLDCNKNVVEFDSSVIRYAQISDISPNIINAFVALEDKRFYKHNGIDYYRLVGAMVNNIKAGRFKEGGSTITQQLAKNTLLSNEKTFNRKIKEAVLAKKIEKKFSKDKILEMYLNAIYFGNGIYGIDSASKIIFNKHPKDLNISEAAMLAGVVKNPKKNNPTNSLDNAVIRKNIVIKLMYNQKIISEDEFIDNRDNIKFCLNEERKLNQNTPYVNAAISEAAKILSISEKELLINKFTIETYLDSHKQKTLYDVFLSKSFAVNGDKSQYMAMIGDNQSGGISAYYANFRKNLTSIRRQPGSVLKPLIPYLYALENGIGTPESYFEDIKKDFGGYSPSNYNDSYLGNITMRQAIMRSSNIIAVDLISQISPYSLNEHIKKLGLDFVQDIENLSLGLGSVTNGIGFKDILSSYMAIANEGEFKDTNFVKTIYDENGIVIYKNSEYFKPVVAAESAFLLTDMLIDTAKFGTAKKLGTLNYQVASKTGTVGYKNSVENSDCWNISYTNDNTVCVWYGNLDEKVENRLSQDATGGGLPTMLAKYIYDSFNNTPNNFKIPANIVKLDLDEKLSVEHKEPIIATDKTKTEDIKQAYFDLRFVPSKTADDFYLPNNFDFNIVKTDNGFRLNFVSKSNFIYIVKTRTLFGDETVVKEIKDFAGDAEVTHETNFGLSFVNVFIEVYDIENNLIRTSPNKTLTMFHF